MAGAKNGGLNCPPSSAQPSCPSACPITSHPAGTPFLITKPAQAMKTFEMLRIIEKHPGDINVIIVQNRKLDGAQLRKRVKTMNWGVHLAALAAGQASSNASGHQLACTITQACSWLQGWVGRVVYCQIMTQRPSLCGRRTPALSSPLKASRHPSSCAQSCLQKTGLQ